MQSRQARRRPFLAVALSGTMAAMAAAFPVPGHADWSHINGDQSGARYLDTDHLRPDTVRRLREAWEHKTGHYDRTRRSKMDVAFDTTPILSGNRLFLCTPFNEVQALDPGTGKLLWRFDPGVGDGAAPEEGFSCRGVTPWRDPDAPAGLCSTRILTVTQEDTLLALDQASGTPCPGFGIAGTVDLSDPAPGRADPAHRPLRSPPPPIVIGTRIIAAAAHHGRPVLKAFDIRTGTPVWTFDPAGSSDQPSQRRLAMAWTAPAVDAARDLIFVPTPRPAPAHIPPTGAPASDHGNRLIALRGSTGEVIWHRTIVHNDLWAYDLPATPTLPTLTRNGARVPALVLAARTGHLFVFHRETGEPLFPLSEAPVPAIEGATGENHLPLAQPLPVLPPSLTDTHLTPENAWGVSFMDRNACAERIAALKSNGLFTPPSRQGTVLFPYAGGGANWGGTAFHAEHGLLFINTSSMAQSVTLMPPAEAQAARQAQADAEIDGSLDQPLVAVRKLIMSPMGLPCNAPPWGQLHAIDLTTGQIKWQSVLGSTRDLAPLGLSFDWGTPNAGGPMVTAGGLVFIGAAMDRYLRAFDAATGEEVWTGRLPAGGQASPMGYVWQGRPYVVIAAGGNSRMGTKTGDQVVAFSLRR